MCDISDAVMNDTEQKMMCCYLNYTKYYCLFYIFHYQNLLYKQGSVMVEVKLRLEYL